MASEALDGEVAAAIDQIAAGLDVLRAVGVDPFDRDDAVTLVREVEVLGRRVDAVRVEVLERIDRRGLHRADGHASAKVMVRHTARLSNAEAKRRAQGARALADLPVVAAAFSKGRFGVCHVGVIARAHANRRVRAALVELDDRLADLAARLPYDQFERRLANWVRQMDEDGTRDANQRNHENRDASLVQDFDLGWHLHAHSGSLAGAELHEIFTRFIDAEFATDWEHARSLLGDTATTGDLDRTDAQRRFDALHAIFRRAADAHAASTGGSQIITDIVIDHTTFDRYTAWLAGHRPDPTPVPLDPDQAGQPGCEPQGPVGYRCTTLDGHPIDPTEAVAHALLGQVRRVVVGADSVVIDLSRKHRLFTNASALAVRLNSTTCYWPGCHVPVSQCQIDHLLPWSDPAGGSTNPRNGGPLCGRHNRHKHQGFTVHRDDAGHWHTHRPDGTEIT